MIGKLMQLIQGWQQIASLPEKVLLGGRAIRTSSGWKFRHGTDTLTVFRTGSVIEWVSEAGVLRCRQYTSTDSIPAPVADLLEAFQGYLARIDPWAPLVEKEQVAEHSVNLRHVQLVAHLLLSVHRDRTIHPWMVAAVVKTLRAAGYGSMVDPPVMTAALLQMRYLEEAIPSVPGSDVALLEVSKRGYRVLVTGIDSSMANRVLDTLRRTDEKPYAEALMAAIDEAAGVDPTTLSMGASLWIDTARSRIKELIGLYDRMAA